MAVQVTHDGHEIGHLIGDVPAILLRRCGAMVSFPKEAAESGQDLAHALHCRIDHIESRQQDTYQMAYLANSCGSRILP